MKNKSKNILITGVSTGIGYEMAKVFISNGYVLYGSVRKQEDADRLAAELGTNFHPLLFDVTDHAAIDEAAQRLEKEIGSEGLGGLINNAGMAIGGPFLDLDMEDFKTQFDINVIGLIKVTKAFLPLLGAQKNYQNVPGKILQISSIAGRQGLPFMSPYAGSKHAVEGVSESLRKELQLFGIDVILIEPGPIKTPIWDKGISEDIEERFESSMYQPALNTFLNDFVYPSIEKALTADRVAKSIYKIFTKKRPRARYLLVPQKLKNWTIPQLLPSRLFDKLVGKALGLKKQ